MNLLPPIILALASSVSDLSNERMLVSGADLEQHWKVDCSRLVDDYNSYLVSVPGPNSSNKDAPGSNHVDSEQLGSLITVAEKCSFIYSEKGTGREISCPDYKVMRDNLRRWKTGSGLVEPHDRVAIKC